MSDRMTRMAKLVKGARPGSDGRYMPVQLTLPTTAAGGKIHLPLTVEAARQLFWDLGHALLRLDMEIGEDDE